jgi:hypothetical protein
MSTMDMRVPPLRRGLVRGWDDPRRRGCSFLPDHVKFLTLETGQIKLRARMCTVCGAVELIGDVDKLERIQAAAAAAQR